jgi:hypothetical protein
MVGEQGVGVRGRLGPHDLGLLVEDVVEEAGVLVGEAVGVLAPDVESGQLKVAIGCRQGMLRWSRATFAFWLNMASTMWINDL